MKLFAAAGRFTADTALRIGKALGMTADYWLNLQYKYDLDVARAKTDTSAIEPLVTTHF